jgi:hypothetical protein
LSRPRWPKGCFRPHLSLRVLLPLRAVTVGAVGIPLAAELTVANRSDNDVAPLLLDQLPWEARYVLGDTHYNDPVLCCRAQGQGQEAVATRRWAYPHRDDGIEVRRIFHKRRFPSIVAFNGSFKSDFEWRTQMTVTGLHRAQLLAWGPILLR